MACKSTIDSGCVFEEVELGLKLFRADQRGSYSVSSTQKQSALHDRLHKRYSNTGEMNRGPILIQRGRHYHDKHR